MKKEGIFNFSIVNYQFFMKLPSSLEKKLTQMFPRARERDQFVAEVVAKALESPSIAEANQPQAIGGTLHLYTDGGARGNPGKAAIGCVLIDPAREAILSEHSEAIGIQTNNIAEYRALIVGLTLAKQFMPNHLVCHLDSELVVKQLRGEYRVKMPTFQPLIEEITQLKSQFPSVEFVHVPRAQNSYADKLVNKALDGK